MNKLAVNICGVEFKNPIIAASGTYGFGLEYCDFYSLDILGGIALKGLTLAPREGNAGVRVAETPMGMLNCVGLQNPGVDHFINVTLEEIRKLDTVLIANIAGNTVDDYCQMAQRLAETNINMLELNISCPNVKEGGVHFGTDPKMVESITRQVQEHAKQPLIVKLSPNVADIKEIALAAQQGGADAVSLINTITGMAIDIKTKKPILGNIIGGLSGPAVKPVALRMVYEVAKVVNIPIIGMGGITCAEDAIEFMLAGAAAVMVGTANISNPMAMPEIIQGLAGYVEQTGLESMNQIVGKLEI